MVDSGWGFVILRFSFVFQQLFPITVDEGHPVQLNVMCEAEPEPSFDWYCNGVILQNLGDFMIRHDGGESTLSIQKPQQKHTGLYKCVASNTVGHAVSEARVDVKKKSKTHSNLTCGSFV